LKFALNLEKNEKTNFRIINSIGSFFPGRRGKDKAEGVKH